MALSFLCIRFISLRQNYFCLTDCLPCCKIPPQPHPARSLFSDADVVGALDELEAATREKIADELNHSVSLNDEYTELTGIAPKED